jgi:CheY-like chemotaxis protein
MASFNSVLLIEDDPVTVIVCDRITKSTGFSNFFNYVENGLEGLNYIKRKATEGEPSLPDLILLDLNMPVMDGWEFLDRFNEIAHLFPYQPAVYILSSSVDAEDQHRALAYPIVKNFLSKPLNKKYLEKITTECSVSCY